MRIYILLFFMSMTIALAGQSHHSLLRTGDAAYNDGEFEKAEINYRKSLEDKRTHKGNFNLGNTIYRQERYDEAVQFYESAANDAENDIRKSEAFYNLGNTHMRVDAYEEAVDAFKYAMALNPEDLDIRKNLYISKLMYQQEQQQQQQQQQSEEQQDQEQQDQDQEQQEQQQQEQGEQGEQENEEQKDGEENEEQNEQNESQDQGEGKESDQEPSQELSKEDAQKLLQVIENEEQKVQEKLRKISGKKKKPKKDW